MRLVSTARSPVCCLCVVVASLCASLCGVQGPVKDKSKSKEMRKIGIDKLVVNICVGESGDKLTKAARVLKELTEQEPVFSVGQFSAHLTSLLHNTLPSPLPPLSSAAVLVAVLTRCDVWCCDVIQHV